MMKEVSSVKPKQDKKEKLTFEKQERPFIQTLTFLSKP